MKVKFNNYSRLTEKKYDDDWYEWCVFVDEDPVVINAINAVEYVLHPSFPEPVRFVQDKSSKFALFSSGWGSFDIKIRINFEDGTSLGASYTLRLERDDWPRKQAPENFADNETKLVYQALLHEKYRWRKLETVMKNSNLPKETVLKILGDLQKNDLVRKALYLSIDGKEMWGATAVVGVSPKNQP